MQYSIEPITLQFKQPAGTSRGVYLTRRLWYVHLYDGGHHGIGECAPLHDLSCDYQPDMASLIDEACHELIKTGMIDYHRYAQYPSVVFALETALLSLEGAKRGDAIRLFDNDFTNSKIGIPINGLVWMGTYEEMAGRIEDKLQQGFSCIKIKIGAIDYAKELKLLTDLRHRFPANQLQIRVDANGGFSPEEATTVLHDLHALQIHSIEQPIKAKQWHEMARLCKDTPIPIALDEELIGINTIEGKREMLDTIRPQYIILKPTLHGGLRGCEEWMAEAQKRNIGYWITSALESNVGLNALAQWAAQTGNTLMPQGLGTGQLFTSNYEVTDLEICGERLWFRSQKQRDFETETQQFISQWNEPSDSIEVFTSGSTGMPKNMRVEKTRMVASAKATLKFLGLKSGDSALLCLPIKYIAGKMLVVRSIIGGLKLVVRYPSSRPFRTLSCAPTFAAITPHQAMVSLSHAHDTAIMSATKVIIIGGGAISPELESRLKNFSGTIYSTYGMTETLSHIAMRKISGTDASLTYSPMEGVNISVNDQGQLQIYAPAINPELLTTNDLATIMPDNTFRIVGRIDNVVCSGGIKIQIEEVEQRLHNTLPFPFVITSTEDPTLGEALTMLYVGDAMPSDIKQLCLAVLSKYQVPRHYLKVDSIPLTETGKPARKQISILASTLFQTKRS